MDIVVSALSFLLISAGVVALVCVGSYWFILRMDDIDHHLNLRLALWAVVLVALGIVGLLWAGSMPDPASFL